MFDTSNVSKQTMASSSWIYPTFESVAFPKHICVTFVIIEEGDYVVCVISKKQILLENLNYWSVELQEAYYSPVEAKIKYEELKKKK